MRLFGRRKALAAGMVTPKDVFVASTTAGTAASTTTPGDGMTAAPQTPAEEDSETPITAPVPIVDSGPGEEAPRPRLRFGFDEEPAANGDDAQRELVPVAGATVTAERATAAAEGATATPRKVISIGFDEDLEALETMPVDPSGAFAAQSGPIDLAPADVDARLRARRIQVRRDEGRRRLRWALIVGAVLTVIAGAGLVLESPLFAINDVGVTGAVYTNPARLQQVVDDLKGATLIGADLGRAEARLAADPWVKRVRVTRRPLRGVRIEIVERAPVATYMGTDQRWRVVDPTGRILAVLDPPGSKPVDPLELVLPQPGPDLEAGATAPAGVAGAADLVTRLPPELRARTCTLGVGDVGQLALNFCDGYVVDLGQPQDLRDKLVTTMFVLNSDANVAASSRMDVADPSHPVLIQK